MKISTRGRYALRIMIDLSTYNTGEPVSLKDVAKRTNISEKYMEQIMSILNKAGYVKSIRGAQGGYILKKTPAEYTVGDILRLTEGDLAPVDCALDDGIGCQKRNGCVTIRIWKQMTEAVNNVVDGITLEDLVNWQEESADSYSI